MKQKFDFHQTKFQSLKEMNDHMNLEERHIDGMDDRCEHESWLKGQFRKSDEWKSFCKILIEKRGGKCEKCGSDTTALCVHHRDPKLYDLLVEEKFSVLCPSCHLKIESYCSTEELMKRCPNVDKKFLTLYPYKEKDLDVLAKGSGAFWKRKLKRELDETKNPGKWINVNSISDRKKKELKEALDFMKTNSNLF